MHFHWLLHHLCPPCVPALLDLWWTPWRGLEAWASLHGEEDAKVWERDRTRWGSGSQQVSFASGLFGSYPGKNRLEQIQGDSAPKLQIFVLWWCAGWARLAWATCRFWSQAWNLILNPVLGVSASPFVWYIPLSLVALGHLGTINYSLNKGGKWNPN